MRTKDWPKACPPALKAVRIDPLHFASHVRLSTCYFNEGDVVHAYETLRKAMALLPHVERGEYVPRLDGLRRQSEDFLLNAQRPDTDAMISILPLEIMIAIMKFGLQEDRDFVLKSSWVCSSWNRTLVYGCPELWGTLTFTSETTTESEKLEAWLRRGQQRIHSVVMDNLNRDAVREINPFYQPYFAQAKFVRINMYDNAALHAVSSRFKWAFRAVEHLEINGGLIISSNWYDRNPIGMLDCNLLKPENVSGTLKTMKVSNVDFRGVNGDPSDAYYHYHNVYEYDFLGGKKKDYLALRSLTVSGCQFDITSQDDDDDDESDDEADNTDLDVDYDPDDGLVMFREQARYQRCPLHNMLKGARGLESLKVIFETGLDDTYKYQPQLKSPMSSRVVLENIRDLTIPPPTVMFLDILAPNVRRLSFVLPDTSHRTDSRKPQHQFRLIPLIEDSPISIDTVGNLTHLEFETGVADTTGRLEMWLSQVPNLTSLSIRGNRSQHSEDRSQVRSGADCPVSECILELLLKHPGWLPKLTELSLTHCELADDQLRKFVKMRQQSDDATALTRLSLSRKENMSSETHAWLHEVVQKADGSGTGFSDRVLEDFDEDEEYFEQCKAGLIGSARTFIA
jgi:hypothetical protein